jgi:hypothetical protein
LSVGRGRAMSVHDRRIGVERGQHDQQRIERRPL